MAVQISGREAVAGVSVEAGNSFLQYSDSFEHLSDHVHSDVCGSVSSGVMFVGGELLRALGQAIRDPSLYASDCSSTKPG